MPQALQLVAPAAASVSVTEPTEQTAHSIVDARLNWPSKHSVHVVADGALSVSVVDPSGHRVQDCVELAL